MYATRALAPRAAIEDEDQRVILHGMTWKDYEVMLALRGDAPAPRLYYLDGEIELMSPGSTHEYRKKTLARLLETWADHAEVDLNGYGSWTLKNAPEEAGAEPDECYLLCALAGREVPDLAIEVEWSRKTGLLKHEIYRRLGVRELWTLQRDGRLVVRVLEKQRYVERKASKVLPKVDLGWLLRFVEIEPQSAAVRTLREELRKQTRA